MSSRALLFTAVAGIALAAHAQLPGVPPSAHLLTGEDIKRMMGAGVTSYGTSSAHRDYVVYYAPNGTFRIASGTSPDAGTYRISPDGKLCASFNAYNHGTEMCYAWYLDGNNIFSDPIYSVWDGVLSSISHKRVPGDAAHL
jgi:hypothetical protein